jgi:Phospholipid-binding protein
MVRKSAAVLVPLTLLAACQEAPKKPVGLPLSVTYEWSEADRCATASPRIDVSGVPTITKTLTFKVRNLDVPRGDRGGGDVEYKRDGRIPAGAFSYRGPCPAGGEIHLYEVSVRAYDASGRLLAQGEARRTFPPEPVRGL